jgi:hypothetical protein
MAFRVLNSLGYEALTTKPEGVPKPFRCERHQDAERFAAAMSELQRRCQGKAHRYTVEEIDD